jgi:hypothetical protein
MKRREKFRDLCSEKEKKIMHKFAKRDENNIPMYKQPYTVQVITTCLSLFYTLINIEAFSLQFFQNCQQVDKLNDFYSYLLINLGM